MTNDYKSELLRSINMSDVVSSADNELDIQPLTLQPEDEPVILVDSDLRKIIIPSELYNIGVCGDQLAETIYFKIPRYFDGDDLSLRDCVIRYINAGNEYGEYKVSDVVTFENEIIAGWKIDNYVTRYSGIINFTIQFDTVKEGIEYQWQTTPAQLNVLAGLNIEKTITEKDDILFRTISNRVQKMSEDISVLQNKTNDISELSNTINSLIDRIEYLENNVVYTLNN